MSAPSLPPFGWTAHSEQVDAASLAARVWQMRTTCVNGITVLTSVLRPPVAEDVRRLEAIWQHRRTCKDPACSAGRDGVLDVNLICDASGRFDPAVTLFVTIAMVGPTAILPSRELSFAPAKAIENHHAAVTLVVGSLATWAPVSGEAV